MVIKKRKPNRIFLNVIPHDNDSYLFVLRHIEKFPHMKRHLYQWRAYLDFEPIGISSEGPLYSVTSYD
jgi:hypothetical protein